MTKKITQWRLDTCGCVMHLAWDPEEPEEFRDLTPEELVIDCGCHGKMSLENHYYALRGENSTKNLAMGAIQMVDPDWPWPDVMPFEYRGKDRQLVIHVGELPEELKARVDAKLKELFRSGVKAE
jgi:hypothetical protein